MPAYRVTGAVKDSEEYRFKLDPINSSQIAIQTVDGNGANVVFKAYLGINGQRYETEVEMLDPADPGTPITDLTGSNKLASIPVAGGFTDLWVIRTDSDASTDAGVLVSITVH